MLPAGDKDEVELKFHLIVVSSREIHTSCKHSLLLLRIGEIIARNMLS